MELTVRPVLKRITFKYDVCRISEECPVSCFMLSIHKIKPLTMYFSFFLSDSV